MPKVEVLAPGDVHGAKRWDEFVMSCQQATFFHRSGWQRVLRDVFRHETHFLFTTQGDRISGVLPLARVKSFLFGNSLVSLPFAVYGGVAAENEAAAAALEREADRLAQGLGVQHLELRQLERCHDGWPTQDLYVTFRKALSSSGQDNMQAIPRKQRAMVRKGIKCGLRGEQDTDVSRFFALYASNVHRHGTPALPKRYFETLRHEFGQDCEILTVLGPSGQILSSVLSFYFRNEVLPYYAGDHEAARDVAANDFKYWELMRRACERGVTLFDYGRSKRDTGPYAFKKNWGFEPTPLRYEYRLYKRDSVPQNNPSNSRYKFLIDAWRRLPLGIATRLGPLVVRSLG